MPDAAALTEFREPGECRVRIDGQEIAEVYPYLKEVRVEMSRQAATVCTLVIDSIREDTGAWTIQDSGLFIPWKSIVIEAVFGAATGEVMRGYIREVVSDNPQNMGAATVTVHGQDESMLLDREHLRKTWSTEESPMTDREVVTQLAEDAGLEADAEEGLTPGLLLQDGTAVRLIRDRADVNGYEFFVREGVVHFHPPRLEGEPQPTIMAYAGPATSCLRFSARFDGHLPDQVRLIRQADTGTDLEDETFSPDLPLLGAAAASSDSMGLTPFVWQMTRPPGATLEEARALAQALANENSWKIRATGELDGAIYSHVLLTADTVTVDGVGDTYGGTYYVDEVIHVFNADGYRQQFTLIKNATGA